MKTQVRNSAFETNSSSTHSIIISSGDYIRDVIPMDSNLCRIYPGECGWGPESHTDAATKASYCLTWLKSAASYGVSTDEVKRCEEMFLNVVKTVTGADEVVFEPNTGDYYDWGYIDHQSIESGGGIGYDLFASPKILQNFIFNRASELVIDNDNR